MQEYFKKPALTKGNVYRVEKYPNGEIEEAEYLGLSETKREHVFKKRGKQNEFIIARDHWIMELDGIVTYKPISSFSMMHLTKDRIQIFPESERSRLVKILADVGAQL